MCTNHWVEIIGSMISPPRCERGDVECVRFFLDDQTRSLHIGPQFLAALEAIHARIRAAVLITVALASLSSIEMTGRSCRWPIS